MQNSIRIYRKQFGWTIQELAGRLKTSEATVSRLETHQLKLSTDWLDKIAGVFGIRPGDLLKDADKPQLKFLGLIGQEDRLESVKGGAMSLMPPSDTSVAVKLAVNVPPFASGDYLIGEMLDSNIENIKAHAGKYCFGVTGGNKIIIGRLLFPYKEKAKNDCGYLAPLAPDRAITALEDLHDLARIVQRINFWE